MKAVFCTSLHSKIILRNVNDMPGIKIGGRNISNLRYADDTVLIAEKEQDLQKLVTNVVEESKKLGLTMNSRKTETTLITKSKERTKCTLKIEDEYLRQVEKFKYLGSVATSDGKNEHEIRIRIGQAKTAFNKMKTILTNKAMAIDLRKRKLSAYIEPILTHRCEAWTINKFSQKKT